MLGVVIALVTLAAFGILLSRTLELDGGVWSTLFSDMWLALTVTHFGAIWIWRIPALAILWLAWGWSLRHPDHAWIHWLMVPAVAAIALTRSETGHPADHGDFMPAVWIDWAHILAAGTWIGCLFGMSLAVFPVLLRGRDRTLKQSADIFQRLSTLSGAALVVLLACGIYNAVEELNSFHALWSTLYGIVLDIKIAIVLALLALGAHNRYVKLPQLQQAVGRPASTSWPGKLFRSAMRRKTPYNHGDIVPACARAVLVESLLGIAVIGATAVLIHAMPPADARAMQPMSSAAPPNSSASATPEMTASMASYTIHRQRRPSRSDTIASAMHVVPTALPTANRPIQFNLFRHGASTSERPSRLS